MTVFLHLEIENGSLKVINKGLHGNIFRITKWEDDGKVDIYVIYTYQGDPSIPEDIPDVDVGYIDQENPDKRVTKFTNVTNPEEYAINDDVAFQKRPEGNPAIPHWQPIVLKRQNCLITVLSQTRI